MSSSDVDNALRPPCPVTDRLGGRCVIIGPHQHPEVQDSPRSAYHEVKDDVRDALAALGLRLVHADGTEPGKSCFGFFCGNLYEASKLWHPDDPE